MSAQATELSAINNQIIFEFLEDTTQGHFNSKSAGGILLVEHGHHQVDYCRWVRVKDTGPDVDSDISVGDVVLVGNLRWTPEFTVNDKGYWITTDNEIIAVWDDLENLPSEVV